LTLESNLCAKEFYINTFFDDKSSTEDITKDLIFITRKISYKVYAYNTILKNIYPFIVDRILRWNLDHIVSIDTHICKRGVELHTNYIDYFLFLLTEYKMKGNFNQITSLLPE